MFIAPSLSLVSRLISSTTNIRQLDLCSGPSISERQNRHSLTFSSITKHFFATRRPEHVRRRLAVAWQQQLPPSSSVRASSRSDAHAQLYMTPTVYACAVVRFPSQRVCGRRCGLAILAASSPCSTVLDITRVLLLVFCVRRKAYCQFSMN